MLENGYQTRCRSLRYDNGLEFVNSNFIEFCEERGIDHQFSSPRTPQQNGVVERKNRILEDMARTMLIASELPSHWWAQAVDTACYILNRAMLRPIIKKTPYELLNGRTPSISHLRIFGCKCYVHDNGKNSLGKFDPRSDEAIFLGYSSRSKAYKVFNKTTNKVEESIHVIFDESTFLQDLDPSSGDEFSFAREVHKESTSDNEDSSSEADDHPPTLVPTGDSQENVTIQGKESDEENREQSPVGNVTPSGDRPITGGDRPMSPLTISSTIARDHPPS